MPGSSEGVWFYADGVLNGPVSEAEFESLASSGRVGPTDYVWHSGLSDWLQYEDYLAALKQGSTSSADNDDEALPEAKEAAASQSAFAVWTAAATNSIRSSWRRLDATKWRAPFLRAADSASWIKKNAFLHSNLKALAVSFIAALGLAVTAAKQFPAPRRLTQLFGALRETAAWKWLSSLPAHISAVFVSDLRTVIEVALRPSAFARERIDEHPTDFSRSMAFFLRVLAVILMVAVILPSATLYGGQTRIFAFVVIQFGIALPLLYLSTLLLRQPSRLSGVGQGVLYVEACFLLLSSAAALLIWAITSVFAATGTETDLLATEYERCLSGQSFVHRLLRDNPAFLSWHLASGDGLTSVRRHADLVIFVPLGLLFGKLMSARYAASFPISAATFACVFVLTAGGERYAIDTAQLRVARNSDCHQSVASAYVKAHGRVAFLKQVEMRISNEIKGLYKTIVTSSAKVAYSDGQYVLDIVTGETLTPNAQNKALVILSNGWLARYCSDATEFKWARAIGVPMVLALRRGDGSLLGGWVFSSASCGVVSK